MKTKAAVFFLALLVAGSSTALAQQQTTAKPPAIVPSNWYDDFLFKDPGFYFEFIRTLGYAYAQGADLGECVSTARAIKSNDIYSWYQEWLSTANRLNTLAQQQEKNGETVSARESYWRASNYYRTAGLYMVKDSDRDKSISAYSASRQTFLKAIASMPDIRVLSIPYEKTHLPGYFLPGKQGAPLLIVHSGFDGTVDELYFEVGVAAHTRGFNVLLFEGPGQGEVIRQLKLPFRYDWEHVVSPVIDYALTLPGFDKNRIALMGISMGGYLAGRACAFDERIKACIVNGGVYSVEGNINKILPSPVLLLLKTNPQKFNDILYKQMQSSIDTAWFFNNAMWTFDASSPADVMIKLQKYNLKNVLDKIKCPMLVIDSEADQFYKGQPEEVYAALKSPKTLLKFTAEETAQAHCQMGATAISNAKVLDWLAKTFQL